MRTPGALAAVAAVLVATGCSSPERPAAAAKPAVPAGAVLLYDVDFSAPEQTTGQDVVVVPPGTTQTFPSRIPSNVFFGHPRVVAEFCGLTHQPARLSVASGDRGIEGLEFLLDQRFAHYHLDLDLCIPKLDPAPLPAQLLQVAVFLDVSDAHAIGFTSAGEIAMVDPALAPETVEHPRTIGRFEIGKPMHLSVDLDSEKGTWHVEKDGAAVLDAPIKIDIPRAMRVIVRGNPTTAAAFDDFKVWAERDVTKGGVAPLPPTTGPETGPE
ncbi:MAG TPA: hypothetical protein VMR31_18310 [Myxococcota bacterium]|nr:hypothetical protein [Myxococcota bacterium]